MKRFESFLGGRLFVLWVRVLKGFKFFFSDSVFNRDVIGIVCFLFSVVMVGFGGEQLFRGVGWVAAGLMTAGFALLLDEGE